MLLIMECNILDYYLHIPLPNNTLITEAECFELQMNVFCCTYPKKLLFCSSPVHNIVSWCVFGQHQCWDMSTAASPHCHIACTL